jgi:hypothetical protein
MVRAQDHTCLVWLDSQNLCGRVSSMCKPQQG